MCQGVMTLWWTSNVVGRDVKRNMTLCVVKALVHKEEEICVCGNVCVRRI